MWTYSVRLWYILRWMLNSAKILILHTAIAVLRIAGKTLLSNIISHIGVIHPWGQWSKKVAISLWSALHPAAGRDEVMTWHNREPYAWCLEMTAVRTELVWVQLTAPLKALCEILQPWWWSGSQTVQAARLTDINTGLLMTLLWVFASNSWFLRSKRADELIAVGKFIILHLWVPV